MTRPSSRSWAFALYPMLDALLAIGTWLLFWWVRKNYLELQEYRYPNEFSLWIAAKAVAFGALWVLLYWLAGLYALGLRRSRLREQLLLIQTSVLGVVLIGLVSFLDDPLPDRRDVYVLLGIYAALQVLVAGIGRFVLTSRLKRRLLRGSLGFNTLLLGGGPVARQFWDRLQKKPFLAPGFRFVGQMNINGEQTESATPLPQLGNLPQLADALRQHSIEEVVVAPERRDREAFIRVLQQCRSAGVRLYLLPDETDWLVGNVRLTGVYGTPLVEVSPHLLPPWQATAKRLLDVGISALALVVGLPLFLGLAMAVRFNSRGPVFYRQQRVGLGGRPFRIVKFRSMYVNAEAAGPALSRDNDPRITPVGRFLRKTHLDELPQFWNVLRGDMSLVGPRPERQFYIDQIVQRAPEYMQLLKVRPGITSWGQVQYGYASTVEEMIERMRYDLVYMETMSLALDFKIMLYTVLRVFQGHGK